MYDDCGAVILSVAREITIAKTNACADKADSVSVRTFAHTFVAFAGEAYTSVKLADDGVDPALDSFELLHRFFVVFFAQLAFYTATNAKCTCFGVAVV